MLLMSGLVVLSFMAANLHVLLWQYSDWLVGSILPAVVVDLTNQNREVVALPSLNRNPLLDQAAQKKAEHMAQLEYFSHRSPDGTTPWHWFEVVGYTFAHAGENLAIHFNDSRALVEAWMNSPTHRENIVGRQYTEIGVGTARGRFEGFDTVYVVQLFGTPAAKPIPPPVAVEKRVEAVENITPPVAPVELLVSGNANNLTLGLVETPVMVEEVIDIPTEANPLVLAESLPLVTEEVSEPNLIGQAVWQLPHLSTSSGLTPLTLLMLPEANSGHTSPFAAVTTQPSVWLKGIYLVLGSIVTVLLLISIWVGYREGQPVQVAHGVWLLLLMSALFALQVWLSTATVVIASGALSF